MDITDMLGDGWRLEGARGAQPEVQSHAGADARRDRRARRPAVMSGIRGETASPEGLQGLLGALVKGDHGRYLDGDESGMVDDGNGILGHIFGSKDVSRGVAAEAAQETGLGDDTMKQMLPMVASLVMGALGKNLMGDQATTKGGGLNDILGQVLGGSGGPGSSGLRRLRRHARPDAGRRGRAARRPAGRYRQHRRSPRRDWRRQQRRRHRPRAAAASTTSSAPSSAPPPRPRSGPERPSAPEIRFGTTLGASTPKGAKGDKMLSKVKKDLGHA